MSTPINCTLTTLAPVHLGADEVYEPLGFVIDEENHRLVAFKPWSFLEQLPEKERQEFVRLCQKGTVASLLEIYRFYRDRRRLAHGRAVAVCPGLVDHYREVLQFRGRDQDLQKAVNRFTIHRTAFLAHDQRPYIPGSAVKGALRTAYLNAMARQKSHIKSNPKEKGAASKLERELLDGGSFETDPFRLLKVSDFLPVGDVPTKIVYAVNEKKKPSQFEAQGPYQILEVIEPGVIFTGTIAVESLPSDVRGLTRIKRFLEKDALWESATVFYGREKQREEEDLEVRGLLVQPLDWASGTIPFRLGRHSGAECVTIEGHRNIRIMQGKGQPARFLDHATTLWLAADQRDKRQVAKLRPMGWTALGELSGEAVRELQAREESWRREAEAGRVTFPVSQSEKEEPLGEEHRPAPAEAEVREEWEKATLTWDPGKGELKAEFQGKKAFAKGKDLVPEALHKRLFGKPKMAQARLSVIQEGNLWRIEAIEEL
jgi:CRISPR-associated protein Csm5